MISKIIGAVLMLCIFAYMLRGTAKVLGWKSALRAIAEGVGFGLIITLVTALVFMPGLP